MGDSGNYDIEIDADTTTVDILAPNGTIYTYSVEELQGLGIIDSLIAGGSNIVVYSQGEYYTIEEYEALFG